MAAESINTLPENILTNYLSLNVASEVLDYFAKAKSNDEKVLHAIILNKSTSTNTLKYLAEIVPENLALMIADNQEKIIKDPTIIDALKQNKNVHESLIERLQAFLELFKPTVQEELKKEETGFKEVSIEDLLLKRQKPAETQPPITSVGVAPSGYPGRPQGGAPPGCHSLAGKRSGDRRSPILKTRRHRAVCRSLA